MKAIVFALLLLAPPLAAADSSLLVGNAGEGMVVGPNLYVRDLYESNSHLAPQFDTKAAPAISAAVAKISCFIEMEVPQDLLARKLTELEGYSPDISAYMLAVMSYYHWILVESPLLPFPDDGSYMRGMRIPLANRLNGTIRIQQDTWRLLTPEHRVALVIHETLSAIQRLDWERNGTWGGNSGKLRETVGLIFSGFSGKGARFERFAENQLIIPGGAYRRLHPGLYQMNVRSYLTPAGTYQDMLEFRRPSIPRSRGR